jgi:hypothetical protein
MNFAYFEHKYTVVGSDDGSSKQSKYYYYLILPSD